MNEHIRPEIQALLKREQPVSLAEYSELRMNSYEQEALVPHLSDEALAWAVENVLKNCSQNGRLAATYNEAMVSPYGPELLRRLKRNLK